VAKRPRFSKPLAWAPSQRRMRVLVWSAVSDVLFERDVMRMAMRLTALSMVWSFSNKLAYVRGEQLSKILD